MKIAVTIGIKSGKPSVLIGPEVPLDVQNAKFKEFNNANGSGWDEIQIISSAGRERRKKYRAESAVTESVEEPTITAEAAVADAETTSEKQIATVAKKRGRPSKKG